MRHIEAMRKSGTNYVPLLLFPLLSVLRLVVAVRTLCRRHRFAFTHIDGVDDIALRIHDLIRTGLGTGITAIQSHDSPPILLSCAKTQLLYMKKDVLYGRLLRTLYNDSCGTERKTNDGQGDQKSEAKRS